MANFAGSRPRNSARPQAAGRSNALVLARQGLESPAPLVLLMVVVVLPVVGMMVMVALAMVALVVVVFVVIP